MSVHDHNHISKIVVEAAFVSLLDDGLRYLIQKDSMALVTGDQFYPNAIKLVQENKFHQKIYDLVIVCPDCYELYYPIIKEKIGLGINYKGKTIILTKLGNFK